MLHCRTGIKPGGVLLGLGLLLASCASPPREDPHFVDYERGPIRHAMDLHAQRLLAKGQEAMAAQDYESAVAYFDKALELKPQSVAIEGDLARARFEHHKLTGPRTLLDRHLQNQSLLRQRVVAEYMRYMDLARAALDADDFAAANGYCRMARRMLDDHSELLSAR